jgi:molybdopterin-containing oxidoreductase family iron-sulfur binding subunit
MSRRQPHSTKLPSPLRGKLAWKSLRAKNNPKLVQDEAELEFAPGALANADVVKPADPGKASLTRRGFLGFGAATAALFTEGCIRRPVEKILPYTKAPEYQVPGVSSFYATVLPSRGDVIGVVAEAHEGRPTKIEGNPDHPMSLGGADMLAQAAIMDLYNPERSKLVRNAGQKSDVDSFDAAVAAVLADAAADGGAKVRVLLPPTVSPTLVRLRELARARFPHLRFHTWAAVSEGNVREGGKIAFGGDAAEIAVPSYGAAKVILSLDSDFLQTEQGAVHAAKGFSKGRKIEKPTDAMSRLYVVESTSTITGANADHRLRLPARDVDAYARALAAELVTNHKLDLGAIGAAVAGAKAPAGVDAKWIKIVAEELAKHKGSSLLVAGRRQPPHVHALVHALNSALDNVGATVAYSPVVDTLEPADLGADLKDLVDDLNAKKVDALFILGANPVYDAPGELKFGDALKNAKTSFSLANSFDETAELCTWHFPMAHELETWGDARSLDFTWSIQQPLIEPLYAGRSAIEILAVIAGTPVEKANGHDLVKATFKESATVPALADSAFAQTLKRGLANRTDRKDLLHATFDDVAAALTKAPVDASPLGGGTYEVVFAPCPKLHDGSRGNNPWLLELPDPMTKIVWDNAALMSAATAKALGLTWDLDAAIAPMISISGPGGAVEIPAWIQPGMPDDTITVTLGWGRTTAGRYGNGRGFNVNPARPVKSLSFAKLAVTATGKTFKVVQTQDHNSMEGRPLAIDATLDEYRDNPDFTKFRSPTPKTLPLWKPVEYNGKKWGMAIDLNACTGCNACVIACHAENNVAFVGKEQVFRGREMHWLRIDRYFVGEDEASPEVAFQPVACVQCEEAPCENVCPVNATAHSAEGLNDMAYNRCIGTRYCANNCPYKVRRFNFLNFRGNHGAVAEVEDMYGDIPETEKMAFNPNVTVRMRGVMEKCSYCVQRIEEAKIAARRENRVMGPKDVVTACQQTCPADAITFGDMNDPKAEVGRLTSLDRAYALLAEVGTHPRTRHLGKIRNPKKEMG